MAAVSLATYRAVHDLVLDPASDGADVGTMSGRLVTEFKGAACAGYSTTTRFVTESVGSDEDRQVVDARSIIIEKPDGSFDFDNQTFVGGTISDISAGKAVRSPEGVRVKLREPGKKTINLPLDVVFPTEQVERTIAAGKAGERFLQYRAYDGLEAGETVSPTTVVIGEGSNDPSDVGDEAPIAEAGYAALTHWPVTISYFDEKGSDQTPDYAMSAILYENGIMRRLRLDYGAFALIGKLVRLDTLPSAACP